MILYIVCFGIYDMRTVEGIFDTLEKAQAFIKDCEIKREFKDDYDIETIELNSTDRKLITIESYSVGDNYKHIYEKGKTKWLKHHLDLI